MINQTTVRYGDVVFATGDGTLIAASVVKSRKKKGGSATITLRDPRLELANLLPIPARDARVILSIAWGEQGSQQRVFEGYAVTFSVDAKSREITISATDKSKVARRVERARNRTGLTLEALAKQIADDSELTLDAPRAALAKVRPFSSLLQHGETDWDLLTRLCDGVGIDCWVDGSTLYLREVGAVADDLLPKRFAAGDDRIIGFTIDIEEKTRRTTSNVVNLRGERVFDSSDEAQQSKVMLSRTGVLLASEDTPTYTDQTVDLALMAGAKQRKVFTAQLEVAPGEPDTELRWKLFIEGFGARFDGVWVIDEVTLDCTKDRTKYKLYSDGAA